ncbi:hypothetical protein [Desulfovibrio inopinatus]|uniref:hypothetical protein n=1 Tax=Desulfovibrio inopinatus TaxID=102109 RepID=UPI00041390A6|nr:hypothetical protein [Desulfovibrio inopinatus]
MRQHRLFCALTLLVCIFIFPVRVHAASGDTLVVTMRPFREKGIDITKEYKIQLLDLILHKTEATDGPYRIEVMHDEQIPQSRVIKLIDSGKLTLIATMTSREREEQLLPIRIPIYRGLFGYRIFIIRRSDLDKFAAIHTADELKALWAGQGHDWPDTKILRANGYHVTTSADYRGLFSMLEKGRFDYFPRAVSEPWREIEAEKTRDIVVEPTLILHYYAPEYFFVSKTNTKLADRIRRGFEIILNDGSSETLFNTHWYIQNTLQKAKIAERTTFYLENPFLTPQTPLDRKELWYQP